MSTKYTVFQQCAIGSNMENVMVSIYTITINFMIILQTFVFCPFESCDITNSSLTRSELLLFFFYAAESITATTMALPNWL